MDDVLEEFFGKMAVDEYSEESSDDMEHVTKKLAPLSRPLQQTSEGDVRQTALPFVRKASSFREQRCRPSSLGALKKPDRLPRSSSLKSIEQTRYGNNCAESPGSGRYALRNGRLPAALSNARANSRRRSQSVRSRFKKRMDVNSLMDEEFRPRVSSCPTRPRPRTAATLHPLSASAESSNEDIYRVRCFTISAKGDVVNRIDSIRSRSNRSINSAHSSSSVGSNSDYKESRAGGASPGAASRASTPHSDTGDGTPLYKVFILGSAGVGKTALVDQFMSSEYMNTYEIGKSSQYAVSTRSLVISSKISAIKIIPRGSHVDS